MIFQISMKYKNMSKYYEIVKDWDFELFDCLENPGMFLWALIVPFGGSCMSAYNARSATNGDKAACVRAGFCAACCLCCGSVYNTYNLSKNLRLKFSLPEEIILSLLFCFYPCGETQE